MARSEPGLKPDVTQAVVWDVPQRWLLLEREPQESISSISMLKM